MARVIAASLLVLVGVTAIAAYVHFALAPQFKPDKHETAARALFFLLLIGVSPLAIGGLMQCMGGVLFFLRVRAGKVISIIGTALVLAMGIIAVLEACWGWFSDCLLVDTRSMVFAGYALIQLLLIGGLVRIRSR